MSGSSVVRTFCLSFKGSQYVQVGAGAREEDGQTMTVEMPLVPAHGIKSN